MLNKTLASNTNNDTLYLEGVIPFHYIVLLEIFFAPTIFFVFLFLLCVFYFLCRYSEPDNEDIIIYFKLIFVIGIHLFFLWMSRIFLKEMGLPLYASFIWAELIIFHTCYYYNYCCLGQLNCCIFIQVLKFWVFYVCQLSIFVIYLVKK